jgi:hypothetical protein
VEDVEDVEVGWAALGLVHKRRRTFILLFDGVIINAGYI